MLRSLTKPVKALGFSLYLLFWLNSGISPSIYISSACALNSNHCLFKKQLINSTFCPFVRGESMESDGSSPQHGQPAENSSFSKHFQEYKLAINI